MNRASFLACIEEFLIRSSLSASEFGKLSVGTPNLVKRLREGKSVTLDTAERVVGFMENNIKQDLLINHLKLERN